MRRRRLVTAALLCAVLCGVCKAKILGGYKDFKEKVEKQGSLETYDDVKHKNYAEDNSLEKEIFDDYEYDYDNIDPYQPDYQTSIPVLEPPKTETEFLYPKKGKGLPAETALKINAKIESTTTYESPKLVTESKVESNGTQDTLPAQSKLKTEPENNEQPTSSEPPKVEKATSNILTEASATETGLKIRAKINEQPTVSESPQVENATSDDFDDATRTEFDWPQEIFDSFAQPDFVDPEYTIPVYYRVTINFTTLPYEDGLGSSETPAFRLAADEVTALIEKLYANTPGEQFVTVIKFQKAGQGILASLDVGTVDNDDVKSLEKVLKDALHSGAIGPYTVSSNGFTFRSLAKKQGDAAPAELSECAEYEFKCADGTCIDIRRQCDGTNHCQDGSDESQEWAKCNIDPTVANVSPAQTVQAGDDLVLHADVDHLGTGTVLWVKSPDNILVIGGAVVVPDPRISAHHLDGDKSYEIRITGMKPSDAGRYDLWVDLRARKLTASVDVTVEGGVTEPPPTPPPRPPPRPPAPLTPPPRPPPRRPAPVPRTRPPPPSTTTQPQVPPPQRPPPRPSGGRPSQARQGRCPDGFYECQSRHCLGVDRWCDNVPDCPDQDDERHCTGRGDPYPVNGQPTSHACAADQFQCSNGQCIAILRHCDGAVDCTDASDENMDCPPKCRPEEMQCPSDKRCVDLRRRCDGRRDCPDGYDEQGCPTAAPRPRQTHPPTQCRPEEMRCPSDNRCVDLRRRCDGRRDCPDGYDEQGCPTPAPRPAQTELPPRRITCSPTDLQCNDGRCVDLRRRCDGYRDCSDGYDEKGCASAASQPSCEGDEFACVSDGVCIDIRRKCDNYPDCRDRSDETGCPRDSPITSTPLSPPMSRCQDGSKPEFSIYGTMYCWSDEVCPKGTVCQEGICCKQDGYNERCRGEEYECMNGQCVNYVKRCNRVYDCDDGSDELNCNYDAAKAKTTTPTPSPDYADVECKSGEYHCASGTQCIPYDFYCNGRADCSDESDEWQCDLSVETARTPYNNGDKSTENTCGAGQFQCTNGDCIPEEKKCNRNYDCRDGTDETKCEYYIKAMQGRGRKAKAAINSRQQAFALETGSEALLINEVFPISVCRIEEFQCTSGDQCIDYKKFCDGRKDCLDGSDELACKDYHVHNGFGRGNVHVDVIPSHQSIREGREAVIQCRAQGYPTPRVSWTKVGGRLPVGATDSNGRLTIPHVRQSDSGSYICTATSGRNVKEARAEITVQPFGPILEQTGPGRCMAGEKTCTNGECVKLEYVCDGERDCRDGSDELNCPAPKPCEPTEFECANRRCVQKMWLCDGDDDCGDGSDERNCEPRKPGEVCKSTEFQCQTQEQCIPQGYQCDGQNDCFDGSDEVGCAKPTIVEPPVPNIRVQPGETITITCRSVGVPVPYVNWRLNWGPVCPPPRCTQTSVDGFGTLKITDARETDSGAYTCEAINVRGRVLATPDCIVVVVFAEQCNPAGSTALTPVRGQCPCKLHVIGLTCDSCKPNTFWLNQANPHGCIRCFCSGVTQDCTSTMWQRTQTRLLFNIGDNQGVTMSNLAEDPRSILTNPNLEFRPRGMITHSEQHRETLYWRLPQLMLGNKITAYGGKLSIKFMYTGRGPFKTEPLIVLKGNDIVLVHRRVEEQQAPRYDPNYAHTIEFDMYETHWEREDGQPATREHLLMALADLSSFLIRATHVTDLQSTSLGEVSMEIAVNRDTQQVRAFAVEECRCPQGYIGLSCEDCAPGFERSGGGLYLGTCVQRREECNAVGALSPTPDPRTGRCQCKAYTTGPKCGRCAPNSFWLSPQNPNGCISCFCSGVTQDCTSSNYYRTQERLQFTDTRQPSGVRIRSFESLNPFRPRSEATVDDRQRQLSFSDFSDAPRGRALYWELPKQFCGDKVTSYGGNIKFVFSYSGSGVPNNQAAMVLRGNDITLLYQHRERIEADRDNTIQTAFYEDRWRREDGNRVTREHLLMTLSDLDQVLLKMTYVQNMRSINLKEVSMDYSVQQNTNQERAMAVEECRCPPGYIGTSCEDCMDGYARSGGGLYLGLCEKCNCHGHATQCDKEFGFCIDCQHNTRGDKCEYCLPGYEGDATRGTPYDCREKARPPRCFCNNHSPRGCDSAGRCLFCEYNTEGPQCGVCKSGFYGDATRGTVYDCKQCPCPGQRECFLDRDNKPTCRSCPPGYQGRLCDECAPGYMRDPRDPSKCKSIGPLRVIISPRNVRTPEGGTVTLRCSVEGGYRRNGVYNRVWTRPGYPSLPRNSREIDGVLTIFQAKMEDTGSYACTVSTPSQRASDTAKLIVDRRGVAPVPSVDPATQTVEEGRLAQFKCTATGQPRPVITWSFGEPGRPLRVEMRQENGVLIISGVRADDQGNYYCTASNLAGTVSTKAVLNVIRTSGPTVRIQPTNRWDGQVGESFTFQAVVTGNPPPTISWFREDRQPFPRNVQDAGGGYLRITNAGLTESGRYIVTAENRVGRADAIATVQIIPSIRITIISKPAMTAQRIIRVSEGDPLEIECRAAGEPEPTIEWFRDRGPSRGDLPAGFTPAVIDRYFVRHPAVSAYNAGEYRCRASNNQARSEQTVIVEVIPTGRRPVLILGGGTQYFDAGSLVELQCVAPGPMDDRLFWSRLNGPMPVNDPEPPNGILRISNFGADWEGQYECQARKSNGETISTAIVQIGLTGTGTSKVEVEGKTIRIISEGDSISLTCEAPEDENAKLSWYHVNQRGKTVEKESSDGILDIMKVTAKKHTGLYKCVATDTDDKEIGVYTVALIVSYRTGNAVDQPGELGVDLEIICPVYYVPGMEVTFKKVDGDLPARAVQFENKLKISNFSMSDLGSYECKGDMGDNVYAFGYISAVLEDVRGTISVFIEVSDEYVQLGDDVTFNCKVTGDDSATLTWKRQTEKPLPSNAEVIGNSLVLRNVQEDDSDVYLCVASTRTGVLTTNAVLNIRKIVRPGAKSVIVNGEPNRAALGTQANLNCPASLAGGLEARISWEKEDGQLSRRTSQYKGILIIDNVMEEDAGNYICTIYQGQRPLAKLKVQLNVTDFIPSFESAGYIELEPLPREAVEEYTIQISFKPESENGIIYHAPAAKSEESDADNFVAVGLRDGKVVYRYNLGSQTAEIESSTELAVGEWHNLIIKRKGKEGTLIVNEDDVNSGVAEGDRSQLKLGKSVFLGGVKDLSTIGFNTVGFRRGFEGTISEYVVNGELVNLGESKISYGGVSLAQVCGERPCLNQGICVPAHEPQGYKCNCSPGWLGFNCERAGCIPDVTCGKGTCIPDPITGFYCLCPLNTTGSSCAVPQTVTGSPSFDGKRSYLAVRRPNMRSSSEMTLRIRPESLDDSLIYYASAGSDGSGDFVGLAIQDGSLVYTFDVGGGPVSIKSDIPLEKDEWFEITTSRTAQNGVLTVGRGRHTFEGTAPGEMKDLNLETNLFFGGVSYGMSLPKSFNFQRSFKGCITSPIITNETTLDLMSMSVDGGNISPCPVLDACASNPCREDATCVSLDDGTYQCDCPDESESCERPVDLCKEKLAEQCGEHGTCITLNATHTRCDCQVGWDGDQCHIAKPVVNQGYFKGNSWIEFGANLLIHSSSEEEEVIELAFTTDADEGVILWQGMAKGESGADKDYLTLGLTPDGQLEYSYELGGGPSELVTTHKVNDGNKHTVKLIRKGKNGQLIVDDMDPVAGKSEGILELLNSDGNYFIGGVPDLEDATFGKHKKNFVGCIGEIRINGKEINFQEQAVGGQNVVPCPVELKVRRGKRYRRRRYHILGYRWN